MHDFRTRMDSSAERLASTFTSKNSASLSASRPRGSRRMTTTASKRLSAARLAIGFSSAAAAANMPGRSMYWGSEHSKAILCNCFTDFPHLARYCIAVATPPRARLRTDGTESEQRRVKARSSFLTSSARASSEPFRASWPLRSSEVTATSVARTRQETRSLSRIRSRKDRKRSALLGGSGTVCGSESRGATSVPSPVCSVPSQRGRATAAPSSPLLSTSMLRPSQAGSMVFLVVLRVTAVVMRPIISRRRSTSAA
mmetsp:Transcript_43398/g.129616  ORF Transcript_43398/g.129616 Transcript_43398/m.129616 type:complete len:256 (-) Transcript_43398:212-979(-)